MNPDNTPDQQPETAPIIEPSEQPVLEATPVVYGEEGQTPFEPAQETAPIKKGNTAFKVLSIILLIAGIIIGFGVGVMINFGSCWKSE